MTFDTTSAEISHMPAGSEAQSPETVSECSLTDPEERPFPTSALPPKMRNFVTAVSKLTRTPQDLVACCALGTLSAAIGRGLRLESVPGKSVPANLYILVGAPSGTGKSSAFKEVTAAIFDYEALDQAMQDGDPEDRQSNRDAVALAAQMLEDRSKDSPTGPSFEDENQLAQLNGIRDIILGPKPHPRLLCEDTTPAALANLLSDPEQMECIASFSSEARDIINRLISKNQSNRATTEGIFLKGYTEEPHQLDRANKEPIRLKRPNLTCLWLVQPDLLHEMVSATKLTEGGLLPRFLFYNADCSPQLIDRNQQTMKPQTKAEWEALVTNVLGQYRFAKQGVTLSPESEAVSAMDDQHNTLVLRRKSDLSDVEAYAARWNENTWRLALVLHVAENGAQSHTKPLAAATARNAIQLMDWFSEAQLRLLAASRERSFKTLSEKIQKHINDAGKGVTVRDITRARITPKATDAHHIMDKMVSDGLLRKENISASKGGKAKILYHPPTQ